MSKKGPKKGQYYSLKQKSDGYFSFFFKNDGHSNRPTSTEDLKSVQDACTLAENRENPDKQTDRQCSGRGQADVISASRKNSWISRTPLDSLGTVPRSKLFK